jgi:hypothetical protein
MGRYGGFGGTGQDALGPASDDEKQRRRRGAGRYGDLDTPSATPTRLAASFEKKGKLESLLSGAGDAASFGFGDELLGGIGGIEGLFNGEGYDDARRRITDWSRNEQNAARIDNPFSYTAGQIGGSLVEGGAAGGLARAGIGALGAGARIANAAKNAGLLTRLGAAGVAGTLGGAAYGYGSADDGQGVEGAIQGAEMGAPTALLGQAGGEVLGRIAGAIRRTTSADARAANLLGKSMDRFNQSQNAFDAALNAATAPGAPQGAMLADVLAGGPQVLKGAGVRPSMERTALRDAFDARNNNMADETANDLWQTLGTGLPKDAAARVRSLTDIQHTQAAPLYAKAYQTPIQQVSQKAKDFFAFQDRPGARFNSALNDARESMRRVMGADVTDDALQQMPEFWHTFLHNVEDRVNRAYAGAKMDPLGAPAGKAIGEMATDARQFNDTVRDMLGKDFRDAQDIFAGAAKSKTAEEFGQDMINAKGDLSLGQVSDRLNAMSPAERQHAMNGALSALEEKLRVADTGSGKADVLRSIIGNESKRRTLNHLFGGAQGFDDLMARMETRRSMFNNSVEAGVGVNSHTADKLAAQDSFQALTNPTHGGLKNAVLQLFAGDAADKYGEDVSNAVIKLLKTPASQVKAEIAQAGSFTRWLQQKGLLQAAIKQQKKIAQQRPKALKDAVIQGVYAPFVGDSAAQYLGLT